MIKQNLRLLIFLFFVGSYSMQAQERITLKQAITYALQNKADAVKSQLDVEDADNQIAESKAEAFPKINASADLMYNPILQKTPIPGDFIGQPGELFMVPFGQKWNSSAGVNLQQMLFNSKVFIGLKAAKTSKEFYQINKKLTDEKLIEKVSIAYYQVFTQKQKLQTIDSSYVNAKKAKDIIENLYQNGLAKEIDLDRIKVNLTNINTAQVQLENAVTQLENALKFYMGMPINQPIELSMGELSDGVPIVPNKVDVDERTEVQALIKRKELLEYNIDVTKADLYPSLYLVGNYAWQGFGDRFPIGTNESQGTYWTDFSSVGIKLNIPIFNGLGTKARVKRAKIEVEKVKEDLKDAKLGMSLEYENAKSQVENAVKSIENQHSNRQLAQKVLTNTQNNYQNGLASLTDLLDAQNAWVEAKNNYTNALLDLKIAEIKLYKANGKLKDFVNQLAD